MDIQTREIRFSTRGRTDIVDITDRLQEQIDKTGMTEGSITVFAVGSTAGITTVEFEPGLVNTDLPQAFDRIAPYGPDYAHHETWGDDNGASHIRSSLLGSSISIPFVDGKLVLGTWQQVIFIDFDTRPRQRSAVIQMIGK